MSTVLHRTQRDVPPPMVGCSVTLSGSQLFVFGGRLVAGASRTITSTLYALSLRTLTWERLWPPPASFAPTRGPTARYFHAAVAHRSSLIIFGGEGTAPRTQPSDHATPVSPPLKDSVLEALSDVLVWDIPSRSWSFPVPTALPGVSPPSPRFASLAVVQPGTEKLYVIGGQEIKNSRYVHEIAVLRLDEMVWERCEPWDVSVGSYRSLAAVGTWEVRGARCSNAWRELPRSVAPGEEDEGEEPIVIFSNSDLKNDGRSVRRELDLISPAPATEPLPSSTLTPTFDPSLNIPPGLRFPSGSIIGRFLLVHGLDIVPPPRQSESSFAIWALDPGPDGARGLERAKRRGIDGKALEWKRIHPGDGMKSGSWTTAVSVGNSLVVLGDVNGDTFGDYSKRQLSFTDVACIDLEASGIYQPPFQQLGKVEQALGLDFIAAGVGCDYEMVSEDQQSFRCPRRLLEDRWPWFKSQLEELVAASSALGIVDSDVTLSGDDTRVSQRSIWAKNDGLPVSGLHVSSGRLDVPLSANATVALLQYFAALGLVTPVQLELDTLSSLLSFTKIRPELVHLRTLVVHALHDGLGNSSFAPARVYEVAGNGTCVALQIRAASILLREVSDARQPPSLHRSTKPCSQTYRHSPGSPPKRTEASFARLSGRPCQDWRATESDVPPSFASLPPPLTNPPRSRARTSSGQMSAVVEYPDASASHRPRAHGSTPPMPFHHNRTRSRTVSPPLTRPYRVPSPTPPLRHGVSPPPVNIEESPASTAPPSTTSSRENSTSISPSFSTLPPPAELPEPMTFSTKSFQLTIPYPPRLYFMPGGTLSLHLRSTSAAPLASLFASVTVSITGISILQGGNLIPSRHVVMEETIEFDLSQNREINRATIDVVLPNEVRCDCHRVRRPLPESAAVQFGASSTSSAADGSSIKVTYRAEVLAKKRGWAKGAERVSFIFPIGAVLPFGGKPLEYFTTREDAVDAVERLPESGWRTTDVADISLLAPRKSEDSGLTIQAVSILGSQHNYPSSISLPPSSTTTHQIAAELGYSSAHLPQGIFLAWRLKFRTSRRDSDSVLRLLRSDALSVVLARRIVPIFADRLGGTAGGARAFPINLPGDSSGIKGPASSFFGESVLVTFTGWFEVPLDLVALPRSCNGEVRYFIVVAIATPTNFEPIKLEVELFRPETKVAVSRPRLPPKKLSSEALLNPLASLTKISRRTSTRSGTSSISPSASLDFTSPFTTEDGLSQRPSSPTTPPSIASTTTRSSISAEAARNLRKGTQRESGNRRSLDDGAPVRRGPSSESESTKKAGVFARVLEVEKRKMDVLRSERNGMVMLGFVG